MKSGIYLVVLGAVLILVAVANVIGLFMDRGLGWVGIIVPVIAGGWLLIKGLTSKNTKPDEKK